MEEKYIPPKGKEWPERSMVRIIRNYFRYKRELGFHEEALQGKLILDLGSGPNEPIANSKRLKELGGNVVSLSPDYKLPEYRDGAVRHPTWNNISVAGIGQELPFADNTFDRVWALTSVTFYGDPQDVPDAEKYWGPEVCRVLKPGGEARLAPVLLTDEISSKLYKNLVESLRKLGVMARIEKIPNEDLPKEVQEPDTVYRLIINKPLTNHEQ